MQKYFPFSTLPRKHRNDLVQHSTCSVNTIKISKEKMAIAIPFNYRVLSSFFKALSHTWSHFILLRTLRGEVEQEVLSLVCSWGNWTITHYSYTHTICAYEKIKMMNSFRIWESMGGGRDKGWGRKTSALSRVRGVISVYFFIPSFFKKFHKTDRITACSTTKRKITLYEPPTVAKRRQARRSHLSLNRSIIQEEFPVGHPCHPLHCLCRPMVSSSFLLQHLDLTAVLSIFLPLSSTPLHCSLPWGSESPQSSLYPQLLTQNLAPKQSQ